YVSEPAAGGAFGGDRGPIPLGVPLLDPGVVAISLCDIEVTRAVCREGYRIEHLAEVQASGGDHGPVPLDIPLLDSVGPVCDIEVASGVHRQSARVEDLAELKREGNHRPR